MDISKVYVFIGTRLNQTELDKLSEIWEKSEGTKLSVEAAPYVWLDVRQFSPTEIVSLKKEGWRFFKLS